jgi:hypothetical protein
MMMRGDREASGNIEATKDILETDGVTSLMYGTLDNIIKIIAGALALNIYDSLQSRIFGGAYN